MLLALTTPVDARGEWPDGPNKQFLEQLQRPDVGRNRSENPDDLPTSCCGVADTVKTKFKVEPGNERYPEDRWYAWLKDEWVRIPPEKIVPDYAPDGQAYIFVFNVEELPHPTQTKQSYEIACFVRPKAGL
jgi:hypothetical protein